MLIGGVMGLAVMVVFGALALAGQMIGIQMGFAIASVVDPATYQQVGVLAQVLNLMGLMLFLLFDGHLMLLHALFDSFHHVPLGLANPDVQALTGEMVKQGGVLFHVGLRIALPVACVVLLVNVGLATIARTVPQVNIFIIGFLITISLGLLIFAASIPASAHVFQEVMLEAIETAVRMSRMF
jgi:flagellar biosynthetic protein FliR